MHNGVEQNVSRFSFIMIGVEQYQVNHIIETKYSVKILQ